MAPGLAVVGLGYVGLPLANVATRAGLLQGHSSYDANRLATKPRRVFDTRGVVPAPPSVEHL